MNGSLVGAIRRNATALCIVMAGALTACSGGGFLPFTPGAGPHALPAAQLDRIVTEQSAAHGIPAALLRAVIAQESGGDPSAVSRAGAMGLMQLMPATASAYGVTNAFEPDANVAAGASYLSDLLRLYRGNISLSLAAYNAGPAAVAQYGGIPPFAETQAYVKDVIAMYQQAASAP
ncbi:MAG: lytic transglycosylase domain-containing protein [Candidatus Eremiobacteraeota bacterium]|nr:lytic transglycosylase domain-containing protein [Candidatus Eremiobacteraeota bacterium]MBC5826254.1 lytic transglycosylase domain-containing protein [Candidatus Eremiobacteraeota bacterium]